MKVYHIKTPKNSDDLWDIPSISYIKKILYYLYHQTKKKN
jgi:hypothetical protein